MRSWFITQGTVSGLNWHVSRLLAARLGGGAIISVEHADAQWASKELRQGDALVMVVPEWNGSFPHTFKRMIDDSGYPSFLEGHGFVLFGTSASSLGNMTGISHLGHILQFVKANPLHRPISIPNLREKHASVESYVQVDILDSVQKSLIG